MKCYVSLLCVLSLFFAISHAAPALTAVGSQGSSSDPTELLMRLSDKFTQNIQLLRRFCPPLFQIIDNVVQNVTSQIFSVVGRVVLRSGLGGGLGGGGESMVSVVLPTFPPDDEDENTEVAEVSSSAPVEFSTIDLDPSYVRIAGAKNSATTTPATPSTSSTSLGSRIEIPLSVNEIQVDPNEQTLYTTRDPSEIDMIYIRHRTRQDGDDAIDATTLPDEHSPSSATRAKREAPENDQEPAASGGNGPEPAEDADAAEEADRDKRYSPFGGDAAHGGGSGNFLFDIIRRTADGAARAAGTIYRMVAGTENLGVGLSASATSTRVVDPTSQLIAGSGATEESDEKEHEGVVGAGGVAEIDVAKGGDGYTEGIPGPITRLFVIANRGLANLVQDLILRLAQTSEKIVNFKARLITALI